MEDNKTEEAQQVSAPLTPTQKIKLMVEYFSQLHDRTCQRQAIQILYEAFYFKCGYLPWWDSKRTTTGTILEPTSSASQLTSECKTTKPATKRPTKVMAVESNKHNLKQFTEEDFEYIIGSKTTFKDAVTDDEELEVREFAISLERRMQNEDETRQRAILKMFQWVTDYNSYEDAYTNPMEKRIIYRKGLVED